MQITDSAPQTARLLDELLDGREVAPAALQAVQRMHRLEGAANLLQERLAAMPAENARSPARREEIVRLLSQVALFRLALKDDK
jgi:hypothetical protein